MELHPCPLKPMDPKMPKKKSDLAKPNADLVQNALLFTIEVFDDPETGEPISTAASRVIGKMRKHLLC